MPEYIVSGRTESGKKITDMVKTATAEDAVESMRDRGFTEIVLHSDELMAVLFRPSKFENRLSYKQILAASRRTPLVALGRAILKSLVLYLAPVSIIALANLGLHVFGKGIDWPILVAVVSGGFLLLLAWLLKLFCFGEYYQNYKRLCAMAEARWGDLLRLTSRANRSATHDRAFMRAHALSGLGRLEEAITEYDAYR